MVIETLSNDSILNYYAQPISTQNGFINLPSIPFTSSPNSLSSVPFSPSPNSHSTTAINTDLLDPSDDSDEFSNVVLTYINQMLMEESTNNNFDTYLNHHTSILATEKPFRDILGSMVPPPVQNPWCTDDRNGIINDFYFGAVNNSDSVACSSPQREYESQIQNNDQSLYSIENSSSLFDGLDESLLALVESPNESILPQEIIQNNEFVRAEPVSQEIDPINKRRKNSNSDELDSEERRCAKYSAPCTEETVRELFDKVLLCTGHTCDLRAPLPRNFKEPVVLKNKRGRRKKQSKEEEEEEAIDLMTLLTHCSQALAIDDHRGANEFLKQIRKHSSPYGDAEQRLAHCFADGLQARLAGTGRDIYRSLVAKRTTTCDVLKAYQLYVTSCPFKKMSHFFSNEVILDAARKATKLHIVDYGIYYGFQWPCFMQRLSSREGGPPKLRITGIDLPQPGFRPAERIEETGCRLAEYAKIFNVEFEYRAIAAKWETIRVEDLNLDKDEILVVNCLYRLRNLLDDTISMDNPRTRVLSTIRKMNPYVFIHGILNGNFSAPFFVTRFREALYHFSTLFDMIEATTSRVDEHRLLIERDLFGREALNVIACEGLERVERPETYKQWQVKNLNSGFRQLPLKEEVVTKARLKVKKCYHRDFVIDQDRGWLLQGWKGRVIYAISAWKPS
ncbi:hypothetical protein LUZ60_011574 [Juncus effusus]|nr:hypothetical protein LUZ60_011574 [Juncus effusus]